ncbi:MAG: diguanylate cyclase [Planctomycetota bacterium]|nr:diguanylate cyclase [Planctomycetota bacterium]
MTEPLDNPPATGIAPGEGVLLKALREVVFAPQAPRTLPDELAANAEAVELYAALLETREFLLAVADGDLSRRLSARGYLPGTLKTLQANLRNLTWQTQRIAGGDLTQRVDFMGEFAEAFNSVTDQFRVLLDKVRLLASRDPLTDLHNRRHFMEAAGIELQRARRYELPMSVLMLDLDHFKSVNDRYGHPAGDQILCHTAAILTRGTRRIDLVARYGGEEFVVLLAQTDPAGARVVADRIRAAIQDAPVRVGEALVPVTASIGVGGLSVIGAQTDDVVLKGIIAQADQALYLAKAAGRNRVESSPAPSPAAA